MNRPALLIVAGLLAGTLVAVLVLRRPVPAQPEITSAPAPTTSPAMTPQPPAPVASEPASRPARRAPSTAVAAPPAEPIAEAPVPAPDAVLLRIDSDVPGAQVFIDRQFIGATPVTADSIKPGSHQLNVSADGFEGIAQTIDVVPGSREITVRFREVRLDARIAVIHKHRMGSCKGELIATPQGIRYQTPDKGDAFSVPLADLETFQVEYLDKSLKVKLRRGRQFNFADPEDNADRLFVFHRDVDKARTRLAKGDTAAQ